MLNNRLEDLIYKYKNYRLKKFIKKITIFSLLFILFIGIFSLYKKNSNMIKQVKKEKKVIKKTPKKVVKTEVKKHIKPKIVKIKQVKKVTIDEEKALKQNSFDLLIMLEKKKPTYQTAFDLANYYYKNGDFKKASKWAIVATNREPKKDKAWIIYAKSKINLNQKGIAKKALKIYLLKYYSRDVSTLLNSI